MHASDPVVYMSALNFSVVWAFTTEEGRLFHCELVLGKKSFSRHLCMRGTYDTVNC